MMILTLFTLTDFRFEAILKWWNTLLFLVMLYMTLSGLEFLAGRMLLEIEFLEFWGEDFAFRSGFNYKLKNVLT